MRLGAPSTALSEERERSSRRRRVRRMKLPRSTCRRQLTPRERYVERAEESGVWQPLICLHGIFAAANTPRRHQRGTPSHTPQRCLARTTHRRTYAARTCPVGSVRWWWLSDHTPPRRRTRVSLERVALLNQPTLSSQPCVRVARDGTSRRNLYFDVQRPIFNNRRP